MDKHLHIVSFTVPYPVVHGGIADLFYKIVALHDAGIIIHLHCFSENDNRPEELNKYCASVNYYPRRKGLAGFSFTVPYIVSSRKSKQLVNNLLKDNHPVLLEGVHSTWLMNDPRLASRKICLRLHNIEYIYYRQLRHSTTSLFKKIYYNFESKLLKKYEYRIARKFTCIFTVSQLDKFNYKKKLHTRNCIFVPVFTEHSSVNALPGKGEYCLYHGNLSVPENETAVFWLIDKVFSHLDINLIVAGRNASPALIKKINSHVNTSIVSNPSDVKMNELVHNAQCHVIPSFNATGVKLKLINALYNGRHCITNKACAEGSELEDLCIIANNALAFTDTVKKFYEIPFTTEDVVRRGMALKSVFNTRENVERLIRRLW